MHSPYLKIITLNEVGSTNSYAVTLAKQGAPEITIVRAHAQLKGRGRLGREWSSPCDGGIYVSFVLRPPYSVRELYGLPMLCALAVVRSIKEIVPVRIKWPNDVMTNDKKIAGILVEAQGGQGPVDFVVVGIGVNVNARKSELLPMATSLCQETQQQYNDKELFDSLIREMISIYVFFKKEGLTPFMEEMSLYVDYKHDSWIKLLSEGQPSIKEIEAIMNVR